MHFKCIRTQKSRRMANSTIYNYGDNRDLGMKKLLFTQLLRCKIKQVRIFYSYALKQLMPVLFHTI